MTTDSIFKELGTAWAKTELGVDDHIYGIARHWLGWRGLQLGKAYVVEKLGGRMSTSYGRQWEATVGSSAGMGHDESVWRQTALYIL